MKSFQVVLLLVFGALALSAVFMFATFSGNRGAQVGTVAIWGSLPEEIVDEMLRDVARSSDGFNGVSYREVPEQVFPRTLVESIATGSGPDLILLPSDLVVSHGDKVQLISFRSVSRRDFQDSFIEAGEVYLTSSGILGLPFYIDPFVLYWNRTLFSEAGVARPPRFWDEFSEIPTRLSKSRENGTLIQSAVALGQWGNIAHAKDIFISLVYGLGNDIVAPDESGILQSVFSGRSDTTESPAESALRFYVDFSDPVKSTYSWNRSQPNARDAFLAGTLAVYLGKASEVFSLRDGNPNLNFDVSSYPRVREGRVAVPAELFALSLPRGARNPQGALQVAATLSGAQSQRTLNTLTNLPSVRRDVSFASPDSPYEAVFQESALNAFSFYDPNPEESDKVFERMIEDVSSGRLRIAEAVRSGQQALQALLRVQ